ncbi:MAG: hypothetical protein QOJ06_291 [Pseudonocardiales bacterium]|nr:hypothetical protein [Pseudonocardiales bacterium]
MPRKMEVRLVTLSSLVVGLGLLPCSYGEAFAAEQAAGPVAQQVSVPQHPARSSCWAKAQHQAECRCEDEAQRSPGALSDLLGLPEAVPELLGPPVTAPEPQTPPAPEPQAPPLTIPTPPSGRAPTAPTRPGPIQTPPTRPGPNTTVPPQGPNTTVPPR